jgi:UDP-N-acetylmuramyl pentapeptide phosphotransferase/UDP-N-acetylglucosamine-1-phosphate transferase
MTLAAAAVSWLACLLLITHSLGHAHAYGQDMPQRFHWGAVPRLGGLGIALGWVGVVLVVGSLDAWALAMGVPPPGPQWMWWCAAMLPSVLAGSYEDLTQRLPPAFRLAVTGLSAVIALLGLDLAIGRLGVQAVDEVLVAWPVLGVALAFVGLAGMPHAFNIIDGYNGLAGAVAMIVCGALAHVALQLGDRHLATLLLLMVGATAGFFVLNYPRGLIFAGDGGAYLWGGVIAIASITLVQRHEEVSPWFPMLLLIYPVWETVFSIYRKVARGVSPGVADALHFHQLIYRRIVREVFHDDEARRMLMRNNRTSPYLWGFTLLTVIPAVLFWRNTPVLMGFCLLFVLTYVPAYIMIVRFKVPRWIRRGRQR